MKKFIFHVLSYLALIVALVYAIPYFFGGPYTDPFYLRFTTPKKTSLVLGTSRAAQAIVPSVMNDSLEHHDFDHSLYNYAFTVKSSPYGPDYLRSILKKLDVSQPPAGKQNLYILAVDPWSLSTLFTHKKGEQTEFEERLYAPGNMNNVDTNPNVEYVYKNLDSRLLMILRSFRHQNHPALLDDGSLAVTLDANVNTRKKTTAERILEYQRFAAATELSPDRLQYLKATLDSLNLRGRCFLVRIPIHPELQAIEDKMAPEFDKVIMEVSKKYNAPYLNYKDMDGLQTNDGNHLDRKSAVDFSKRLAGDVVASLVQK